jgi:hypothetical protein
MPGIGQYESYNDSEGNRLGVLEPTAEDKEIGKKRRQNRLQSE